MSKFQATPFQVDPVGGVPQLASHGLGAGGGGIQGSRGGRVRPSNDSAINVGGNDSLSSMLAVLLGDKRRKSELELQKQQHQLDVDAFEEGKNQFNKQFGLLEKQHDQARSDHKTTNLANILIQAMQNDLHTKGIVYAGIAAEAAQDIIRSDTAEATRLKVAKELDALDQSDLNNVFSVIQSIGVNATSSATGLEAYNVARDQLKQFFETYTLNEAQYNNSKDIASGEGVFNAMVRAAGNNVMTEEQFGNVLNRIVDDTFGKGVLGENGVATLKRDPSELYGIIMGGGSVKDLGIMKETAISAHHAARKFAVANASALMIIEGKGDQLSEGERSAGMQLLQRHKEAMDTKRKDLTNTFAKVQNIIEGPSGKSRTYLKGGVPGLTPTANAHLRKIVASGGSLGLQAELDPVRYNITPEERDDYLAYLNLTAFSAGLEKKISGSDQGLREISGVFDMNPQTGKYDTADFGGFINKWAINQFKNGAAVGAHTAAVTAKIPGVEEVGMSHALRGFLHDPGVIKQINSDIQKGYSAEVAASRAISINSALSTIYGMDDELTKKQLLAQLSSQEPALVSWAAAHWDERMAPYRSEAQAMLAEPDQGKRAVMAKDLNERMAIEKMARWGDVAFDPEYVELAKDHIRSEGSDPYDPYAVAVNMARYYPHALIHPEIAGSVSKGLRGNNHVRKLLTDQAARLDHEIAGIKARQQDPNAYATSAEIFEPKDPTGGFDADSYLQTVPEEDRPYVKSMFGILKSQYDNTSNLLKTYAPNPASTNPASLDQGMGKLGQQPPMPQPVQGAQQPPAPAKLPAPTAKPQPQPQPQPAVTQEQGVPNG